MTSTFSHKAKHNVTQVDLRTALKRHGGPNAQVVLHNARLEAAVFEMLKAVAERRPWEAGAAALDGLDAKAETARLSPKVKLGVKSSTFVVSQFRLSMGLRVLTAMTPGRAAATLGATMVVKTGLMLDLMGEDHQRLSCTGALMELGGNAALTGLTWETGVGAVLGLAAIAASAANAYETCSTNTRPRPSGDRQ